MDCITFNKDIDDYIRGELMDDELNDFINHLSVCPKCAEELEINYIVTEGTVRLDKKKADFNLKAAYNDNVISKKRYMSARKKLIRVSNVFRTLSFWAVVGAAFVFLRTIFF